MDTMIVLLILAAVIAIVLVLFAIMGRTSDPEPRDTRIEGPGIPLEITDEELDAILRKHGLL